MDSDAASVAAILIGLILLGGAIAVVRKSESNDVPPVLPPPAPY